MTPQDILNHASNAYPGVSAPDVPISRGVRDIAQAVAEHFHDHKGHAALLAASLPVAAYGGYRAMRKTPEADPEPSLHTQQATVEMSPIQQGSDKIALEVMAAFGLRDMLHMDRLASGAHPALPPGLPPAVARISSIPAIAQKWVQEQARSVPKALAPLPVQRPVPGVSPEVLARFGLC